VNADPEFDIADAFVERAMGADVATVVIGGKVVVEDHRPRTIDVEGLYREVRAFCAKGLTPEQRARAEFFRNPRIADLPNSSECSSSSCTPARC